MGRVVPAVSRAFDILELFLDEHGSLSVPDITARLNLPRTTVHELVSTLVKRGYLQAALPATSQYELGVKVLQLGSVYAERLDLATLGQDACVAAARESDEAAHVAILDGRDIVYISKANSVTRPFRLVSAVGQRIPAHCTALGKVLLSHLSEGEIDALYADAEPLVAMAPKSMTSLQELRAALGGVRRRGIATEYCESSDDVACIAAPVYDRSGRVVAAMSISVPSSRWTNARANDLRRIVARSAAALSERLGFTRTA